MRESWRSQSYPLVPSNSSRVSSEVLAACLTKQWRLHRGTELGEEPEPAQVLVAVEGAAVVVWPLCATDRVLDEGWRHYERQYRG
jgi:hypothetical protein